ncbi:hypothetical protein ABW19_dt0203240 [Dactylella cylindrospora]|nr:hypothetical protein ABW19_dt0203240 [Dactylella cylindrospora]
MSTTKTLKLLNSITTTTSASHRRRRSSAAVTAAMFQTNVQTSFFPHCQPQQFYSTGPVNCNSQSNINNNGLVCGNGNHQQQQQQYHQFLPLFVTPTTPASSDHHTTYHGTNVTSPPPFYFHTPPISSVGGAGAAALTGNGKNVICASGLNQQQQQQLSLNAGIHSGNHNHNHAAPVVGHSHHKRNSSLHQDALNKKHGGARSGSISQFSVAGSSHFQFAFEAQLQQNQNHSPIQESSTISAAHNTNCNSSININPAISAPSPATVFSKPSAAAGLGGHSRQSSLHQVQFAEPQQQHSAIQQQQQQPPQQSNPSGFCFLPLNPEPVTIPAVAIQQPQISVTPQIKTPSQGLLPGGFFFSLTPEDSYPPLCTSTQPSTTLKENQAVNSYFPIMPLNPVVQQVAPTRATFPTGYMRPSHQRLTRSAVAAVDSRDSREFRWNRVLRYVHEISAPHGSGFPPSDAWVRQQRMRTLSSPRDDINDGGHSLWDGGSLGTNGVDDFIWDDDLQNGKRFTIPPKSQQGDALGDAENLVFNLEPSKSDLDLAFGYEVDDSNFRPPAKRTKSNESQKAARRGLHEYLAALKSFELSHVQDMKREAPLTMA